MENKIDKQLLGLVKIVDINSLVISGGGTKGYLYLGAIKLLADYGILNRIKYYYGTSFGGLIVTALNLGWNLEETIKFSISFPLDCIIDYDIDNFIANYGLVPKINYETIFKKIIKFKGHNENITFKELYVKTSKELHLIAFSLKQNKSIDLNYETTPDLKIWEGLYMTSALPILIPPFEYNNDIYIDGGISENFAMNRVKLENKNKSIGICTGSYKPEWNIITKDLKNKDIIGCLKYLMELFKIMFGKNDDFTCKNYITLFFDKSTDSLESFNYSINQEDRYKFMQSGYDQSLLQFHDVINTIFKKQINNNIYKTSFTKYNEI